MTDHRSSVDEATKAVEVVEALEPDKPWADNVRAAEAATATLIAMLLAALFPWAISASGAYAALTNFAARAPGGTAYGDFMAALHARALASFPALAALIRSPETLDDVGRAAASRWQVLARSEADLANEARDRFALEIARQLAAAEPAHESAEHARSLITAAALRERLAVAKARHEAAAVVALADQEAERRKVAAALLAAATERAAAARQDVQDLESQRIAAEIRARNLLGVELAAAIRARRIKGLLAVGSYKYDPEEIARIAENGGYSTESLARYRAALDAMVSA